MKNGGVLYCPNPMHYTSYDLQWPRTIYTPNYHISFPGMHITIRGLTRQEANPPANPRRTLYRMARQAPIHFTSLYYDMNLPLATITARLPPLARGDSETSSLPPMLTDIHHAPPCATYSSTRICDHLPYQPAHESIAFNPVAASYASQNAITERNRRIAAAMADTESDEYM